LIQLRMQLQDVGECIAHQQASNMHPPGIHGKPLQTFEFCPGRRRVVERTLRQDTGIGYCERGLPFNFGRGLEPLIALERGHRLSVLTRQQQADALVVEGEIAAILFSAAAAGLRQMQRQLRLCARPPGSATFDRRGIRAGRHKQQETHQGRQLHDPG